MAGIIPTNNPSILKLRESGDYDELIQILYMYQSLRTEEQSNALRSLARKAYRDVIRFAADAISVTSVGGTNDWAKPFVNNADICMNDEACAAVPAEIVNGWRGDKVIPVFRVIFVQYHL